MIFAIDNIFFNIRNVINFLKYDNKEFTPKNRIKLDFTRTNKLERK